MPLIYIQGEEEKQRRIHYEVDPSLPSLGEGGMGQVLKGVQVNEANGVRRDVAIKFLFEDLPSHAIERARREASIQISNENLVEMFGFIEVVENPESARPIKRFHVVSELLQGVMLFDLLNGKTTDKNGQEVPFAQELYQRYQSDRFGFAVFIVKNILSGLMALHDKGYIHRDLDPSNIMITTDRKVKIIDFGIAKRLDNLNTQDQQLTSTGQFIGKAAYAAPELVLGDVHNQDKTTDIYAVGIMLFQFITGTLPFEGTMAELQSAAEMRVDLEHLSKADAVPTATSAGQVVASLADVKSGKGKMIGIAAGAVVVLGIIVAFVLGGSSEPKPEPVEDQKTEVVAEKAPDAGKMVADAVKQLNDPTTVVDGIKQLTEVADKYGNQKEAADGIALLAALTQPADIENTTDEIKELRAATHNDIIRDIDRAHAYAEKAVKANPESYKALYELATDYLGGEARMNQEADFKKALELFMQGQKYAEAKGDKEYTDLFNGRIELVKAQLDSTNE